MKSVSYFLASALCAGGLVDALGGRAANWTVGQVVQTSSGPVTGHGASVEADVSEYLGIPYAVPPVGDLRWSAPQAFNGTSAINGSHFGFSCPRITSQSPSLAAIEAANVTTSGLLILANIAQAGDNYSEDCLTLNVWTKPQVGEPKKAVLVWIYGGAFSGGSSDDPAYNGQFIADQEDVVLVSFNYRLTALGFPGAPGSTQNLGLLDQRVAIEWVRDNIAAFGGDPSRITLFGQSAGSASVDYYTYAWADDPIAHGFIEESGTVFGLSGGLGPITADVAAGYWFNLTTALNCGNSTSDSAATLTCMKSKSFTDILKAVSSSSAVASSMASASFGPTVDNQVVFSDYLQRSVSGNFTKLPLLIGNNDYEAGLFKVAEALSNVTFSDTFWDDFNNVVFVCPASTRANISLANKVPTWRYRWFGAFPNTELSTIPFSGAWHASELIALFDSVPSGSGVPNNTPAEVAIGSYLRGAWATFAKNPTNGLTTYQDGWPNYAPGQDTLVRLAFQNTTGANLALGTTYDGGCQTVLSVTGSQNGTSNSTSPSSSGRPLNPSASGTSTSSAPGSTSSISGVKSSRMLPLTSLAMVVIGAVGFAVL